MPVQLKRSDDLVGLTKQIRADIVRSTTAAGSGHPSSSLSMVEILTVLYFGGVLRYDPETPAGPRPGPLHPVEGSRRAGAVRRPRRSRLLPREDLMTLRKLGSPLEGHPNMCRAPGRRGLDRIAGAGPLDRRRAHAHAGKLDGRDYRVYVMVGDGESEEGQVWEAIMYAGNHGLDNLTLIIDRNGYQQTGCRSTSVQPLDPLAQKLAAFGWEVTDDRRPSPRTRSNDAFDWARSVDGASASDHREDDQRERGLAARSRAGRAGTGNRSPPDELEQGPRGDRGERMSFGLKRIQLEEGPATREAFGEALAEAGCERDASSWSTGT